MNTPMQPLNNVQVINLGLSDYVETWQAMQNYTQARDNSSSDQLWFTEHPAVFTQGLNGKAEHVLNPGEIPVVPVDRGGQVTYHGPGQLIMYVLISLTRRKIGVRSLVSLLEQSVINLLQDLGITAEARADAPGVYVQGAKIAALGLKIRKGCSYHGLSLNHQLDLEPFSRINPCGFKQLPVTSLQALNIDIEPADLQQRLQRHFLTLLPAIQSR